MTFTIFAKTFPETEESLENWTTLRYQKCHRTQYDRHSFRPVHCTLNHYTPCLQYVDLQYFSLNWH